MNIEVEIRSFLSKEEFDRLSIFLKKNAKLIDSNSEVTYYYDCLEDLRIQKNNSYSKAWLKKGNLHDDYREEIEIINKKEDFEKLNSLFEALGYKIEIKWFRDRKTYEWENIKVMMDYTKGYGYIIELEIMSDDKNKDSALELLKQKLSTLNIQLTKKEEFAKQYEYYKNNWKTLTGEE